MCVQKQNFVLKIFHSLARHKESAKLQKMVVAQLRRDLLAVVTRLLPHPPNFAPMTALALFSGVVFRSRWMGIGYVLGLMFLSDVLLNYGNNAAQFTAFLRFNQSGGMAV